MNYCAMIKLMQKGFAPILILIGVLIMVAVAGGAYYLRGPLYQLVDCPNGIYESGQCRRWVGKIPKLPTPQPSLLVSSVPDETVYTERTRSANWKTYIGSKFSIRYPSNLVITPSGLIEVIESVQFGDQDNEEINYIRVIVSSGGEIAFKNKKETYLTYGIYNPKQEELSVGGLNAWQYSGTDADGRNLRQYILFYKDDLQFEIDNFGINKNIFNQILSTFKFTQ